MQKELKVNVFFTAWYCEKGTQQDGLNPVILMPVEWGFPILEGMQTTPNYGLC